MWPNGSRSLFPPMGWPTLTTGGSGLRWGLIVVMIISSMMVVMISSVMVMMISSMMVVVIIFSCTVSIIDIISIMNMHPAAGKGLAADHSGRHETHVCFPLQVFSLRPSCLMTLVHVVLLYTHVLADLRTLVQTRSPVLVVCGPQY